MADDKEFITRLIGLLSPLGGVTCKPMFGGYGIFHEGSMFALVKGTGLFFKVDDSNRSDYEEAGSKQYKPMPYFQVPANILADTSKLQEWARVSVRIAHAPPSPKKKR